MGEESPKGRRGINIPSREVKFIQLEFHPHPGRRGYNTPMSGEEKAHRTSYMIYLITTAACNDGDGTGGNGAGDSIFNEGASLADILVRGFDLRLKRAVFFRIPNVRRSNGKSSGGDARTESRQPHFPLEVGRRVW